jgi:hypothetical protein|tara:strand:+ start:1396 stop:2007 length:612 start_codon:yes stop_codon:yes gene_type:complete
MAKCPPGVICFENFTFTFIIISLVIIIYFVYSNRSSYKIEMKQSTDTNSNPGGSIFGLFPRPSYSFSNVESDVLMNPYAPPLKDERVVQVNDVRGGVPININTRAVDTNYRQVGILKRMNGPEMILPLMGRPLYVGRDKWQYYTMSDSNNQIKLPVSFKSRSCTNEYGCDEISNGDTVYVDGIDATFQTTIYDNATMRYLPFI